MERLDLSGNNELEGKTSSDESSTHYLIRLNSNEKTFQEIRVLKAFSYTPLEYKSHKEKYEALLSNLAALHLEQGVTKKPDN